MNKIKSALLFFAGLLMFSCSESDEALLYDNYDFMSINGDSVICADGLEMLASEINVIESEESGTYSVLNTQVTVGNNVFTVKMIISGSTPGKYEMKSSEGYALDYFGYVKYRSMQSDSTFVTDKYAITTNSINWEDVDNKTVLLNVDCKGVKLLNDSTFTRAAISLNGKIRAIKR